MAHYNDDRKPIMDGQKDYGATTPPRREATTRVPVRGAPQAKPQRMNFDVVEQSIMLLVDTRLFTEEENTLARRHIAKLHLKHAQGLDALMDRIQKIALERSAQLTQEGAGVPPGAKGEEAVAHDDIKANPHEGDDYGVGEAGYP